MLGNEVVSLVGVMIQAQGLSTTLDEVLERPYEASLFPGIGFGLSLHSLDRGRRRPPSAGGGGRKSL
ncbi:hypothetical protein RJT34_23443 [Clitoria ternatea]|uniref:Uncharacterized protein n=1 Tax=Clitoria ternatea TaxID=43366 RepID=A0AAN9FS63_CLITE